MIDSEREVPVTQFEAAGVLLSSFERLIATLRVNSARVKPEMDQELSAMLRLSKLTLFYFKETTVCLSGSAFFAANVMGAAGLESLFLLMCLTQKDAVIKATMWEKYARGKTGSFLSALGKMNLEKLIGLTRIIHDLEDTKSLFCYKHVAETVFVRAREAFACLTIARHSVCCYPIFFPSLWRCSSISGRAVPTAEPCC
jgi:hypothetical protein